MLQSVGVRSVIVLNDFCQVQGGASRVAVDEAVALDARGFDVTFLGAVGPVCLELRAANVKTVCLDQPELADAMRRPTAALRAFWNQRAYRATRALLGTKDRHRTIVHLHGYTKALTAAPALAARARRISGGLHAARLLRSMSQRGVLRLPPTDTVRAAGTVPHLHHNRLRQAAPIAQGVSGGARIGPTPCCAIPFASVRDYITLSRRSASLLKPYLPGDARFHETGQHHRRAICATGERRRQPGVGCGRGGSTPKRGWSSQRRRPEATGLPIVFVGDGPLRSSIEATGARVTGWVTTDRVQLELEQARCLVFPSLWYETYGLVVAEAAARGRACRSSKRRRRGASGASGRWARRLGVSQW